MYYCTVLTLRNLAVRSAEFFENLDCGPILYVVVVLTF